MYAVIRSGGQQFRVSEGDTITVKRLDAEVGSSFEVGDVLLVAGGESAPRVGAPLVEGVSVVAEVVSHGKGDKRETFRYSRRHRTRVQRGFRPSETTLTIKSIRA